MSPIPFSLLRNFPVYRLALLSPFFLLAVLWHWRREQRLLAKLKPRLIPTYRANGRRVSDSTHERAERLLAEGKVVATRSRHGRVIRIQFTHDCGADALQKNAHMGQHYSYRGEVRVWKHRDELGKGDIEALFGELTPEELRKRDLFVRAVFRAVPLSCMKPSAGSPQRSAKVVSIEAGRKKSKRKFTHRPVEFDSEGRLAA